MKRFGYDNPYAKRPRFPWGWLIVFLFAIGAFSRIDAPWNPLHRTTRPKATSPAPTPRAKDVAPSVTPRPTVQGTSAPTAKPKSQLPPRDATLSPSNLPMRFPGSPQVVEKSSPRIEELEAKIKKFPVFALFRSLEAEHLRLGNREAAARTMRTQAQLYLKKGLRDAATILSQRAARYETSIRAFAPAPIQATKLAPLEPRTGCYQGAFIDRDDALKQQFDGDNWQYHHLPSEFAQVTQRRHASYFTYVAYGNFPRQWLRLCKREGVIPQIAWEPQNLAQVRDDAYLRSCAQFLRDLDWPVFVRFAGEMNGDWTPYHGNPGLYREKFRLVHRVLHRYAPKVATIWCVNAIPFDTIQNYYPGDDSCDWVGVNLYSTPFADNDKSRAAFQDSPLTLLDPIYRRFAQKKPIAICEYAASHRAAVDKVTRVGFAIEKMSLLYSALPVLYPRVKLIDWFSSNNLRHARAGRQLNNYSLTDQEAIKVAYRRLTGNPHFLTSYLERNRTGNGWRPQGKFAPRERLALWVTSPAPQPKVVVQLGNKVIYAAQRTGAHLLALPPGGQGPLTVAVFDTQNRCTGRKSFVVCHKGTERELATSSFVLQVTRTQNDDRFSWYRHRISPWGRVVENLEFIAEVTQLYELPRILNVTPVSGGTLHRLMRIETEDGTWALKILNPLATQTAEGRFRHERAEVVAQRAKSAGIPAMVAHLGPDGSFLQKIGEEIVLLYPWHEGKATDASSISTEKAAQMGGLLARLHDLEIRFPDQIAPVPESFERGHWEALLEQGHQYGSLWVERLEAALSQLVEVNEISHRAHQTLCEGWVTGHLEYTPGNVLWSEENPTIFDWESVSPVHPAFEALGAALVWANREDGESDEVLFKAFMGGYCEVKTLASDELDIACDAVMGKWLLWLEFNLRRSLGPGVQGTAEERIVSEALFQQLNLTLQMHKDGNLYRSWVLA